MNIVAYTHVIVVTESVSHTCTWLIIRINTCFNLLWKVSPDFPTPGVHGVSCHDAEN